MELTVVPIEKPDQLNVIIGQAHFIKTVEDLYEAIVGSCAAARFGIAFCEASGPCLIRCAGNDDDLVGLAARNAQAVGAGHVFVVMLRDAFPINVMPAIKAVTEVCAVFCATANPVAVLVAQADPGRGVIGVIDGSSPAGIETPDDVVARQTLLRQLGYKL